MKGRDLLSIAYYNLFKRGKKLLKSSQRVILRSKPQNKSTIEGRGHKGKWLYCMRKPPKTEAEKNESVHFNLAFVKKIRQEIYGEALQGYSVDISIDDEAYVLPGTDVGFRVGLHNIE